MNTDTDNHVDAPLSTEAQQALNELNQVAQKPSKKGFLRLCLLMLIGVIVVFALLALRQGRKENALPSTEVYPNEITDNVADAGTTSSIEATLTETVPALQNIPVSTPTSIPASTSMPSPTPLSPTPAPIQLSITYPQVVPSGLPQPVAWTISATGEALIKISDFGSAMLAADPEIGEVTVSRQINQESGWEIFGYIDPQATQGAVVLEIYSTNGYSESISLVWQAGAVIQIKNGQVTESIDGIPSAWPPYIDAASNETKYPLSGGVTVRLPALQQGWTIQPTEQAILIYLSPERDEQETITIAPLLTGEIMNPEQALNYLLDTHNGAGGVVAYGELVIMDEGFSDTTLDGYPARHMVVQTADGHLFGLLEAVAVGDTIMVIQGFFSSSESVDHVFEWINGLSFEHTNAKP